MKMSILVSLRILLTTCIGALTWFAIASAEAQPVTPGYVFTHLAGPLGGPDFVDGTGAAARFDMPRAVVADRTGNLYVADQKNYALRKISPTGVVTTLALVDSSGAPFRLYELAGVTVDSTGTFFVTDIDTDSVYRISPTGVVSPLAGAKYVHLYNGGIQIGESRDGTGTEARFFGPAGLAVDRAGNVFVADSYNRTIRQITPGGVVTTFAGTTGQIGTNDGTGASAQFSVPTGVTLDSAGNLYVTDGGLLRRVTPAGDVTTIAGVAHSFGSADGTGSTARFYSLSGVALDSGGNLYVSDIRNQNIRKITPDGVVTTVCGAVEQIGSADGTGAAARFFYPTGLAIDSSDTLFAADMQNHSIRRITAGGVVTTFASTFSGEGNVDAVGTSARFSRPAGIAIDSAGTIYVADTGNRTIRKVSPAGVVSTLTSPPASPGATGVPLQFSNVNNLTLDQSGNLYVGTWSEIQKITPAGIVTALPSGFADCNGMAVDKAGNIYFTDGATIKKLTPGGATTVLAGLNFAGAGIRYADGTGTDARFSTLGGLVLDDAGNLIALDAGNAKLRKITPEGVVTTLPVNFTYEAPMNTGGLARDSAGNLYLTDPWLCTATKIALDGTVTSIGGMEGTIGCIDGTGNGAHFNYPRGIAVDRAGVLYIADTENAAIRQGVFNGPPVITTQPVNQAVTAGDSVQFSVKAAAVPAPTYQWFFNGSTFNGATTNTLSFTSARSTDAGDYTVVVANPLGSVTSAKATLTISAAPPTPTSPPVSGGGGGSVDSWFVLALLALGGASRWAAQRNTRKPLRSAE